MSEFFATVHTLKVWPEFYAYVQSGAKPFEVRRADDRTFHVGDILHLVEWSEAYGFSGRSCVRLVTYLLDLGTPPFDAPGLVVMGLSANAG